nr:MAG TPA: major capsid protein [Bacteriophage sp.]
MNMARINSLSILLSTSGKDQLAEKYGPVIENLQKATISGALKNTELSGDPTTGTVEAKRFVNAASAAYGTARAAQKGTGVKASPVTVALNVDKEIIEEIEEKDVRLYGVDNVINRRVSNHGKSMERELERAFFKEAATAGTTITLTKTSINEKVEELIQSIEATKNDFVDGVDRDMISIVLDTATYGELRSFLDTGTHNANVDTNAKEFGLFHGVRVYSSVYLPTLTAPAADSKTTTTTVHMIGMVNGSVALPVMPTVAAPEKIQLSNAIGFGIFYSYGAKAVMPDLIKVVSTSVTA